MSIKFESIDLVQLGFVREDFFRVLLLIIIRKCGGLAVKALHPGPGSPY